MAANAIAGMYGRIVILGSALTALRYKLTPRAARIPTHNFESYGSDGRVYEEQISGVCGMDIEFEWGYNRDQRPQGFSTALIQGQSVPGTVYFYLHKTGDIKFSFPYGIFIDDISFNCDTDDSSKPVWMTFKAHSQGEYSWPA